MMTSVTKIKIAGLFAATLFFILLGTGCKQETPSAAATETDASQSAPVETVTDAIDLSKVPDLFEEPVKPNPLSLTDEDVIVTVEGKDITHGDIMKGVQMRMMQLRQQASPQQLAKMQGQIYKNTEDTLIANVLLNKAAEESGLAINDEELQKRIDEIRSQIPEGKTLEDALAESNIEMSKWKDSIRQQLLVNKLVDEKTADIKDVDLGQVASFYQDNIDQFKTPETVSASHILIKFEDGDTDEIKAQKKEKLAKIKKQIDEGAGFEEMATEYSDCPSSKNGGVLGSFPRGQMVPEFEDVAFSMEPGTVSDIVETKFGYHLIKVTDHQDAGTRTLTDVQDKLTDYLNNQKKQEALIAYISTLRTNADITIHERNLDAGMVQ